MSLIIVAITVCPELKRWFQQWTIKNNSTAEPLSNTDNYRDLDGWRSSALHPTSKDAIHDVKSLDQIVPSYTTVSPGANSELPTSSPKFASQDQVFITLVVRSTKERLQLSLEVATCALQFLSGLVAIFTPSINGEWSKASPPSNAAVFTSILWAYILALVITRVSFILRSKASSVDLWSHSTALYLFTWIFNLPNFRSSLIHPYSEVSKKFHIAQFVFCTILFVNNFSVRIGDHPARLFMREGFEPSLESVASIFSLVTFSWINPILWKGYFNTLNVHDVWELHEEDQATSVLQRYRKAKQSFGLALRAILHFKHSILLASFWAACNAFTTLVPTLLMNQILEYIEDPSRAPKRLIWLFTFGMLFFGIADNVFLGQSIFIGRRMSMRLHTILIGEIYSKALRRRESASKEKSLEKKKDDSPDEDDSFGDDESSDEEEDGQLKQGAVLNLMAVDAEKVADACTELHDLVGSFLTILFAIILLYRILGWSSLVGSFTMIAMTPVNYYISEMFAKYQDQLMSATDERVDKINELLSSIRIVKYFAWENKFAEGIRQVRETELAILRKRYMLWALSVGVWFFMPVLISMVSFSAFIFIQGGNLTAPVAFTTLAIFNVMEMPMDQLADMINNFLQSKVSIDRIERFLQSTETSKYKQLAGSHRGPNSPDIGFDSATFSWESSDPTVTSGTDFKLRDLDIAFKIGELNVVVGPTGSGKTSLLLALLGEMELVEGRVFLPSPLLREDVTPDLQTGFAETVAYCAQQAWLLNNTVRNNILFGREFDQERYDSVVAACALKRDLEILDAGDLTEIGENGITLSGGQKQRVSLARAVYSNSKHLLLDYCLSAVDSHTALWIYEQCLTGPTCAGRTVILVSHNVALTISQASHVVVMDNGRVAGQGSPSELASRGLLGADELVVSSAAQSSSASRASSAINLRENNVPVSSKIGPPNSTSTIEVTEDLESKRKKTDGKLVQDETKFEGRVSMGVYAGYLTSMGGAGFWLVILITYIASPTTDVIQSWWLHVWTSHMDSPVAAATKDHSPLFYIGIYVLIGFVYTAVSMYKDLVSYLGGVTASRKYFNTLLDSILKTEIRFFDSTPIGRIMNRFSKDMEALDQDAATDASSVLHYALGALSTIVLIAVITPWFLVAGIAIAGLYWGISTIYIETSRDLKRINSVTASPIYQHFGETLAGIATIRAYGVGDQFMLDNLSKVNDNNRSFFYLWNTNRWLSFRVDLAGALVSFSASAMVLLGSDRLSAGLAGLSLSYAITFSENILWMIRLYASMEMNLNSIERIQEYMNTPKEAPDVIEGSRPPANWPSRGEIEVENLSLRYAPELPLVIKDVTFKVDACSKIGIVGRTGAGKSTIITAFFRFLEADSGRIKIDGVDISIIGLKDLREQLAIIPQDPTLFTGTLRSNLDPFEQYSDAALYEALRRVHLIKGTDDSGPVAGVTGGSSEENVNKFQNLDMAVAEGGKNLSQGQRQLVCLARSLIKSPKILLLDEATASIDYESDAQIQKTIREEFAHDTTILTIAHRLRSIVDYDRILVMEAGAVVEYAAPSDLLGDKTSRFYGMCADSGELDALLGIAKV